MAGGSGSDGLKRDNSKQPNAPRWQSLAERVRLQSGSPPVQIRPLALTRYPKAQDDLVLGFLAIS